MKHRRRATERKTRKVVAAIPVPVMRKRLPRADKAYARYKRKHPSSRLQFDKFMSVYGALAGTRAGYRRIKRRTGADDQTIRKIDLDFKIRSKALRRQIEREEKARGKRLEEVVSPEYIADAEKMLGRKGEKAMTYTKIGAVLREKYGRGDRHTVVQIAEMRKKRREKETARGIASRAVGEATQKVKRPRFERLLFATETVINPKTGNEITRMKYSLPEIAKKLKLSVPGVHARWRRNHLDQRTEAANKEVADRKRAENIARAKASPTLDVAVQLLNTAAKDEAIIEAIMALTD